MSFGSQGSSNNKNTALTPAEQEALTNGFLDTVKKGDILITDYGVGGAIGHSAMMISDAWVLEMPGGPNWYGYIESNNRRLKKHTWYDMFGTGVNVFRNRDADVADAAAEWAVREYYNPDGGSEKTKHITYGLTTYSFSTINPSYCSKLVLQAFHYGTGDRKVIKDMSVWDCYITPWGIPDFFLSPYTLENKGHF